MSTNSNLSHTWLYQSAFLLDNISDCIISTDLEYRIKSWNKSAEEMFGLTAAEVLERPIYETVGYTFRTDSREIAYSTLKEKGRWKGKVLHIGKNGTELFLEINSSTLKSPDGNPVGYVSIYRDITDMHHVEKDLLAEQHRMNDLIQNVPGVVYQWAENYDGTYGFTYLGPKIKEYFGIEQANVNLDVTNLIHPEDRKRFRDSIEESNRTEKPWEFEGRLLYPDGQIKWWRGNSVMAFKTEKGMFYNGIIFDITLQKNMERQLVEEEAHKKREIIKAIMEAQEKERREISSELHDNVNQILTTCKLFLEIARNNPENSRFIDEAHQNIQVVIEEIRNISHNLAPYSLKDLGLVAALHDTVQKINQSGKLLIRLLSFQNLQEDNIGPDIKLALFRIIQEKISNVLKHSQASELTIELSVYDGRVLVVLTDNGQGFDEKAIKKGMGLNNIRNRVEYFKGIMHLRTAPGAGCELRIELPCQ